MLPQQSQFNIYYQFWKLISFCLINNFGAQNDNNCSKFNVNTRRKVKIDVVNVLEGSSRVHKLSINQGAGAGFYNFPQFAIKPFASFSPFFIDENIATSENERLVIQNVDVDNNTFFPPPLSPSCSYRSSVYIFTKNELLVIQNVYFRPPCSLSLSLRRIYIFGEPPLRLPTKYSSTVPSVQYLLQSSR